MVVLRRYGSGGKQRRGGAARDEAGEPLRGVVEGARRPFGIVRSEGCANEPRGCAGVDHDERFGDPEQEVGKIERVGGIGGQLLE